MKRILLVLALLASVAHAQQSEQHGMPATAFVFEARLALGGNYAILGFTGTTATTVSAFTAVPSLFLGARLIDRLHVGLGFGFIRAQADSGGSTAAFNIVTFVPTLEADLVKSSDNRVAFYAKLGLPLGPVINCPGGGASCDNNFAVGFDFALGGRYALHRMFALGLEAGFAGTFVGPQRNNTSGLVTVYGGLVGTFMSGH